MRVDCRIFGLLGATAAVACGSSSSQGLFTEGKEASAASNGGVSASGGATTASGGRADAAGAGGMFESGGSPGEGGSNTGGLQSLAGAGGAGGHLDGGLGGSGGNLDAGSHAPSVACGATRCSTGEQCCVDGNNRKCVQAGTPCCTGLGCAATTITCDSQTDCTGGAVCCANVTYGLLSTYVTTIECQESCNTPLVEYPVCDVNGPDTCTGNTTCASALLISGFYVCQ